jgi:hypothetical protein
MTRVVMIPPKKQLCSRRMKRMQTPMLKNILILPRRVTSKEITITSKKTKKLPSTKVHPMAIVFITATRLLTTEPRDKG